MKIYTRQGDSGQTSLFDGRRVAKNNLRIDTYGTVDELNSTLGLAIAFGKDAAINTALTHIQHQLFDLGAELATPVDSAGNTKVPHVGTAESQWLEEQIDLATAELPPLKEFILPGGQAAAAQLHVARTVCRRAERLLVTLMAQENIGPGPLMYLNRLSDYLFVIARLANHRAGAGDIPWRPQARK
ncbi:MAG: cob(I)yrinic acid a,c-diamide adenosyltransferase [Phycisphaerales bacterium]|nr:cob(I)yrinic acid a,c-diamide adenosyltransferase [Phycisphaerales bacterium]